MLKVKDVSTRLGIPVRHVRALIHARRLRALNMAASSNFRGRPRYYIDEKDLERFLQESATDQAGVSGALSLASMPGVPRRTRATRAPATEALAFLDQELGSRRRKAS